MHKIKSPIYQIEQIRELERIAFERFNIASMTLMQRAGKAAFDFMVRRFPQAKHITFFCGAGNNGGDGYVLAQLSHERGLKVSIWQVGKLDNLSEETKQALADCEKSNIFISPFDENADLAHPDLIVDAVFGIGVQTELRSDIVPVIQKMQRQHVPIFSLDIPSGIHADNGQVLGTAVQATATITFIGLKLGLMTGLGIAHTGELAFSDLQLPLDLLSSVPPIAEKMHLSTYADYLKPRTKDWHKGMSGHVLVIGGDEGYSGAARMAAEAALRVGAGLVTVATHPSHAAVLNITCPEIMCRGIHEAHELDDLLEKASMIILGPGLGQSDWSKMIWERSLQAVQPKVVDADALNLLAGTGLTNDNWVLTPHPGEAGRLLNMSSAEIQQDRLKAIKAIQLQYGGVCVLKGAGSLILAANTLPALCEKGNPGMASAGMGDVLSGVIGGLIAQGIPLGDAAKIGVYIHALAGDYAAKEGERGMVAMDLMPFLHHLVNYTNRI
ncbi:MAG: NAD(P)H-hydrate dehydratase [Gammaproteobacteria bacterium]